MISDIFIMLSGAVFCGECRFTHGLDAPLLPFHDGQGDGEGDTGDADILVEGLYVHEGAAAPGGVFVANVSSDFSDEDITGADADVSGSEPCPS